MKWTLANIIYVLVGCLLITGVFHQVGLQWMGNAFVVIDSTKTPGTCRVIDGLHNNGGWEVKMTREACVKKIQAALSN